MRHHTKDKGDCGLGFVIADLLSKNIQVALPISEHLPFDCIAINEDNELAKVSVKYRKLVNGKLTIPLRSSWADRHGTHVSRVNLNHIDGFAVYCPDNCECYYIASKDVLHIKSGFHIRVTSSYRFQKNMNMACNFKDASVLFAPVV